MAAALIGLSSVRRLSIRRLVIRRLLPCARMRSWVKRLVPSVCIYVTLSGKTNNLAQIGFGAIMNFMSNYGCDLNEFILWQIRKFLFRV